MTTTILPDPTCSGCYVVANVTGIVFGSQVINQVLGTVLVAVPTGINGTQPTLTSVIISYSPFSFGPTSLLDTTTGLETPFHSLDSLYIFEGITLASPTSYDVVSDYTTFLKVGTAGNCSSVEGRRMDIGPLFYPIFSGSKYWEQTLIGSIGLPTCTDGITQLISNAIATTPKNTPASTTSATLVTSAVSTLQILVQSSTSSTFLPSSSSSSSSSSPTPTGFNIGAKIGVSIAVPVVVIVLFMLGMYLWRKDRRQRLTASQIPQDIIRQQGDTSEDFVRQKAELDAEQRRHEMEANERRYELEEEARHELEAKQRRQELKGEDYTRELGVPK